MTVYIIGISPEMRQSNISIVDKIEAAGGVMAWENVWFIESEESPSEKFDIFGPSKSFHFTASGGAFVSPVTDKLFEIAVDPRCSIDMRKFYWDKILSARSDLSEIISGNTFRYINNGKIIFAPIVRKFMQKQQGGALTTPLCEIMARNGSDKGLGWHNYTPFYSILFEEFFREVNSIFELGLGTNFMDIPSSMGPDGTPGASLRGWREYFPHATVYGGDIDQRVLFTEDRIQTYFIDQMRQESFEKLWECMPHLFFDIVIDDGLHEPEAAFNTIKSCFSRLKPGGLYVIEDVCASKLDSYATQINEMGVDGIAISLAHPFNKGDNCLIIAAKTK